MATKIVFCRLPSLCNQHKWIEHDGRRFSNRWELVRRFSRRHCIGNYGCFCFGRSTSGGSASGIVGSLVDASASGGSTTGGDVANETYTNVASASGGSTSAGGVASEAYIQSEPVTGGSTSGGSISAQISGTTRERVGRVDH